LGMNGPSDSRQGLTRIWAVKPLSLFWNYAIGNSACNPAGAEPAAELPP
jgi:hypothetical protein